MTPERFRNKLDGKMVEFERRHAEVGRAGGWINLAVGFVSIPSLIGVWLDLPFLSYVSLAGVPVLFYLAGDWWGKFRRTAAFEDRMVRDTHNHLWEDHQ